MEREIDTDDVDLVLRKPDKVKPGYNGAINYWGCGVHGYRIRVTIDANGAVKTVAWADPRK